MPKISLKKVNAHYLANAGKITHQEAFNAIYPKLNYDTAITVKQHIAIGKWITKLNSKKSDK